MQLLRPLSGKLQSRRRRAAIRSLDATVVVTRVAHFNAAHRLHNPDKSARWNRATFGPCNNPKWHGHNYRLEVSVRGRPDPETGFVVDLHRLGELVERHIVAACDHRNLNEEVPFPRGLIPSAENLVVAFWHRLAPRLPPGVRLHRLRLYETERNFADYHGEPAS